MGEPNGLFGRRAIYTDVSEIDESNVVDVLSAALQTHLTNRAEIEYLYNYYKGKQPVLWREKDYTTETIKNYVVENRANEIVSFKVGYLIGEPVQYVNRGRDDNEGINVLNDYVFSEDKNAKDKELADWFTICGQGYRMIVPALDRADDESPFHIYTLDPRNTFVVQYSGLDHKPVMGCTYIVKQDKTTVYCVYTDTRYFEISGTNVSAGYQIDKNEPHILGEVPIVEYLNNSARLGAFEIVLPLLDAINETASNRQDAIAKYVQALLVLKGVEADDDQLEAMRDSGAVKVPNDGDVKYLTLMLDQNATQTVVNHMYQSVLTICGMPNRNGGSSTSDTGVATIYRDGWSSAEGRAKDSEAMFKLGEKRALRLMINIANTLRAQNLRLSDIDIRFTRRNYEDIQTKSQVLTTMLNNDKIAPRLAFEHCGLFVDPELAYTMSQEYAKEAETEQLDALERYAAQHRDAEEADEPDDAV